MDNALGSMDKAWWKVLFVPYSDDELTNFGVAICNKAISLTPCKTQPRNLFDSPVYSVVNSPGGKDRVIQEYERRLQTERTLVQSFQHDYDSACADVHKLTMENAGLRAQLEE
jgi:hypothetical protein